MGNRQQVARYGAADVVLMQAVGIFLHASSAVEGSADVAVLAMEQSVARANTDLPGMAAVIVAVRVVLGGVVRDGKAHVTGWDRRANDALRTAYLAQSFHRMRTALDALDAPAQAGVAA
jgi:hypothetical protein